MIINPIYVGFIVVPPFNLHFVFWYSFFPFSSFSLFILARGSSNLRSLLCIFKVRFSTVNPLFVFHLLLSLFLLLVVQGFLYDDLSRSGLFGRGFQEAQVEKWENESGKGRGQ